MSDFEPLTEGITLAQSTCRRISEIMDEKGKAYSQQAIATRLKMNSDTLRMKLRGKRKIYAFELERIADALHISVERLLQTDTAELEEELDSIFSGLEDPEKTKAVAQKVLWSQATSEAFASGQYDDLLKKRALEISKQLTQLAIGITEVSKSLNNLGRAYFYLHQYQDAHNTWLHAYSHAKKLASKKNADKLPLFNIIMNLMISYSNRKEYSELARILSEVESVFNNDPRRTATIQYALAKIAERNGELEKARNFYYSSLDAYRQTQTPFYIAKALHNTACFEFRQENLPTAKRLFEEGMSDLSSYTFENLICTKEYCKTLLLIGDNKKAEKLIVKSLNQLSSDKFHNLKQQFLILLAFASEDPQYAQEVLDSDCDQTLKNIACKFLMDFFDKKDDSYSLMKYYRIAKGSCLSHRNILFEEDL